MLILLVVIYLLVSNPHNHDVTHPDHPHNHDFSRTQNSTQVCLVIHQYATNF